MELEFRPLWHYLRLYVFFIVNDKAINWSKNSRALGVFMPKHADEIVFRDIQFSGPSEWKWHEHGDANHREREEAKSFDIIIVINCRMTLVICALWISLLILHLYKYIYVYSWKIVFYLLTSIVLWFVATWHCVFSLCSAPCDWWLRLGRAQQNFVTVWRFILSSAELTSDAIQQCVPDVEISFGHVAMRSLWPIRMHICIYTKYKAHKRQIYINCVDIRKLNHINITLLSLSSFLLLLL